MLKIPEAALGAITAAFITALISLLGLIISKEQKTSEFRQQWIDDIRKYITIYLTQLRSIQELVKIDYNNYAEKIDALKSNYECLNDAYFNITLRLNPTEARAKAVLGYMNEVTIIFNDEERMNSENLNPIERSLIAKSHELLKYEWNRVKGGEKTFSIAKYMSFITLVVAVLSIIYLVIHGDPSVNKFKSDNLLHFVVNKTS